MPSADYINHDITDGGFKRVTGTVVRVFQVGYYSCDDGWKCGITHARGVILHVHVKYQWQLNVVRILCC